MRKTLGMALSILGNPCGITFKTFYRHGVGYLIAVLLGLLCGSGAHADNLFVVNNGNNTIGEFTTSGAVVNGSLISGLNSPDSIAVSGSNLFVTNQNGTIGEYTTSGTTVNASLVTGLSYPVAIAVSGSNLFVVNLNGTIGEYTTSGAVVNASLISGLSAPLGIAVSGSNLFVANAGSSTIGEYTTSGADGECLARYGVKLPSCHRGLRLEPVRRERWRWHDWRIHHLGCCGECLARYGFNKQPTWHRGLRLVPVCRERWK